MSWIHTQFLAILMTRTKMMNPDFSSSATVTLTFFFIDISWNLVDAFMVPRELNVKQSFIFYQSVFNLAPLSGQKFYLSKTFAYHQRPTKDYPSYIVVLTDSGKVLRSHVGFKLPSYITGIHSKQDMHVTASLIS